METFSCEYCGGSPYPGFDCQTGNTSVYDQGPCYNQDFGYNQSPFYSPSQPQQFNYCEICGGPHYSSDFQTRNPLDLDFESHFNLLQRDTNRILEELLRTLKPNSSIGEPEGSDEYMESSVDDFVPILKESEVTSGNNLECDMPVTIPLPTTDVRKENFDINSPLGEQVVDFLMENEDVAGLPRHLVKQFFSNLVKNPSSIKRMSDEPLGDDSKPRSYDVTFSNSLFDFNDDYTLCYDNLLFDEEFEDINSLDPPKSATLNYEPLDIYDSVSRIIETSDLILEELTAEIGQDDSILAEIDDGYYDSEGDILFLEHLLIEETFFDSTLAVLPKKCTLLITPPPASKQFSLREVERFYPFFYLTQSGAKAKVIETPFFSFHHMPSPRPAAYSPKEVMYRYYHPYLTSGDGFDLGIK
ncbi:hypothetical protein Tco_0666277, partial [Tanacetum coccineum]